MLAISLKKRRRSLCHVAFVGRYPLRYIVRLARDTSGLAKRNARSMGHTSGGLSIRKGSRVIWKRREVPG